MQLPQELVDTIIDYLHNDIQALKSCSLTCQSWAPSSRYHLFETITFDQSHDLGTWTATFPSAPTSPACQVRSLSVCCPSPDYDTDSNDTAQAYFDQNFDHWSAFNSVRHLTIFGLSPFQDYEYRAYFGHLASSLRSLRLHTPHGTPNDIIAFVCIFPHLDDLSITGFSRDFSIARIDELSLPIETSPTFNGRLELFRLGKNGCSFLGKLLELPLGVKFRSIELSSNRGLNLQPVEKLLARRASSLETLGLGHPFVYSTDTGILTNLTPYTSLRHLRFHLDGRISLPVTHLVTLLTSCTSPVLSEVIFQIKFPPAPVGYGYNSSDHWLQIYNAAANINNTSPISIVFETVSPDVERCLQVLGALRGVPPESKKKIVEKIVGGEKRMALVHETEF